MSGKETWMSGGSSGVYDPVTTGDEGLGVHYSDRDDGWLRFKGRKYNFGTYRNSGLKGLCDDIRNKIRPKCMFIGFISVVLLILLIAIIVIASARDTQPNPNFEKWVNRSTGLNFRPFGHEGTVFLPFSPENKNSFLDYTKQLNASTDPYKTLHIHNGPNIVCNSSYAPADRVCQQPITVFGTSCVNAHNYGYAAGQPCVLLTFTVPKDYTVRALAPKDQQAYVDAESILGNRFSRESIGISCEPATPDDKRYVGNTSGLGEAIDYNPKTGFPTYFFRKRTIDNFVPPAVMVQFRTIRDSLKKPHMVRLTCKAFGVVEDPQGKPVSNDLLTTSFVFRIH